MDQLSKAGGVRMKMYLHYTPMSAVRFAYSEFFYFRSRIANEQTVKFAQPQITTLRSGMDTKEFLDAVSKI